jgi:hypothetical protein
MSDIYKRELAGVGYLPYRSAPVSLQIAELGGGLRIKVEAVETAASRRGAPHLASLGKIVHIAGDHYVGIKRVFAVPTIAVGIVQGGFFLFSHAVA